MQNPAPIVLFVYNRLWHTQQTVEALRRNELASDSELIIFSDGPKTMEGADAVRQVREYLRTIDGFKRVEIHEREKNLGLANSVIAGVTDVVNQAGRIIVLEDDMITSPYFLRFMNDALEKYQDEDQVISVHAYLYPIEGELPETFFLKGADCWGWATWKRGWDLFEPDGRKLLSKFTGPAMRYEFDFFGGNPYYQMLKNQINGKVDSWAVRWYASAFLAGRLTLYPGKSLVLNIGNDASGTHCGNSATYNTPLNNERVELASIPLAENIAVKQLVRNFFMASRPSFSIKRTIRQIGNYLWG